MGYRSVSTAVAAVVLGATVMLAGCASSGGETASTPSPSAAVPAPAPSSASPTPPSDPASAITCDELLPASVRDGLAPGLTATPSSTPDAGSYAAQIAAEGGTVCQWTAAGGDTLSLAVARPSHDALTAAETGIGNGGTATTAFGDGVKAWTIDGGGSFTGDFEVFTEAGYWISTVSSLYTAPDSPQAKTVVDYVLQALPSS